MSKSTSKDAPALQAIVLADAFSGSLTAVEKSQVSCARVVELLQLKATAGHVQPGGLHLPRLHAAVSAARRRARRARRRRQALRRRGEPREVEFWGIW